MSTRLIAGVETEYGIVARGLDITPMTASALLVNAFSESGMALRAWDFSDESPGIDARGDWSAVAEYPEVEVLMANSVLTNGARYYVDHAHPEYSTPECTDPLQVVLYDRAGEETVVESLRRANSRLGRAGELIAHKNNSDGKGNSYGFHENYLVPRSVPFGRLAAAVTSHFVTRQVFCGAGKVGVEVPREGEGRPSFQVSQRADFFEEPIGLETTVRRPVVNTRDEPHADPEKWRRLHVIVGDANMAEVATYLKVGTTALVLGMIEDGVDDWPLIVDPVTSIRSVSHDPSLRTTVETDDGRRLTALEVQFELLARAIRWSSRCDADPLGGFTDDVLRRWERVLGWLEVGDPSAARWVDWVAKRRVIDGVAARDGLSSDHPRLRAVDLQWHDMRPERNLARRAGLETLVDEDSVRTAMSDPPATTRAYFRGECIRRWPDKVSAANWDSIVFDDGGPALQRVPMLDPAKGTKELVGNLLGSVRDVPELLAALGSDAVEEVVVDPGW